MSTIFYLPSIYNFEYEVAAYIARLIKSTCKKIDPVTDGLNEKQSEAVVNACTNSISILCGKPGTGKTTTLRRIIDSFQQAFMTGLVIAPSAKAAKRAHSVINTDREITVECKTIHRGLSYKHNIGFSINMNNKFDVDYIVLEEFSMCDLQLLRSVLCAIDHKKTRIIFSGDNNQLPSIGSGNISRDMISCGVIPTIELKEIFRQGKDSGIVYNAARILDGLDTVKIDPKTGMEFEDFYFVPRESQEKSLEFIVSSVQEKITNKTGIKTEDIQVLSPGRKSVVGTNNINDSLRLKLNPSGREYRGFRIGDKVINRKNNYDKNVVNGDSGVVTGFIEKEGTVIFNFGPGTGENEDGVVKLQADELNSVYQSYCITIHSSQGSEFEAVIIPIHTCHTVLLFRELLYTAVTRSRKLSVVVGDPKAYSRCIFNNGNSKRKTGLSQLIKNVLNCSIV